MQELLSADGFSHYISDFGYLGILLFFLTVDQLSPIPEEISLIGIGYLSYMGVFNPFLAVLFAFIGLQLVDIIYYWLARRGSRVIMKLTKLNENSILIRYTEKLKTHLGITLMVLCFIPRLRIIGPITVGMLKIKFLKFLVMDAPSLLAFTTIYIFLGLFLHNELNALAASWSWGPPFLVGFGMATVVLVFFFVYRKATKLRKTAKGEFLYKTGALNKEDALSKFPDRG